MRFSNLSRGIYNFINARGRAAQPPENRACPLAQRYSRNGCKSSEIRERERGLHIFSRYRDTYVLRGLHRNLSTAAVINNAAARPRYITHNDVITGLHFRGPLLLISPPYLR